jgi:threonine/homoserine/homoserine lactone efflux protein
LLFHAVPVAYTAVKLLGAGYLIVLGLKMLLRGCRASGERPEAEVKTGRRAFLESITVEVLNPKTALFFLAFLPQFTDVAATLPVWVQMLVLGTLVNVIFSSADLLCVALAGALMRGFRRSGSAERIAQALGGTLLVGLGANLATQRL